MIMQKKLERRRRRREEQRQEDVEVAANGDHRAMKEPTPPPHEPAPQERAAPHHSPKSPMMSPQPVVGQYSPGTRAPIHPQPMGAHNHMADGKNNLHSKAYSGEEQWPFIWKSPSATNHLHSVSIWKPSFQI